MMNGQMRNGEYCTIAAEIDAELKTHYVIKIGQTIDHLTTRADKQRLKLVWGHKKLGEKFTGKTGYRQGCEKEIMSIARFMFGDANFIDWPTAGYSEMFGDFATAHEANEAAWELLTAVRYDERFSQDEFWVHPKAIRP